MNRFVVPIDELIITLPTEKYSPNQPRAPKGTADGGQWIDWANAGMPGGTDFQKIAQEAADEVRKDHPRYKPERTELADVNAAMRDAANHLEWRDWYDAHEDLIVESFGPENANIFEKFLAAGSIQTTVPENVKESLSAFQHLIGGGRFDDGSFNALSARLDQYQKIANGLNVTGPKIRPFYDAMAGDAEAVAMDRWMRRMLFVNPVEGSSSAAQTVTGTAVIRAIAKKMNWEPRQVQAVLWTGRLVEREGYTPTDYRRELLRNRDMMTKIRNTKGFVFKAAEAFTPAELEDGFEDAAIVATIIEKMHEALGTKNPTPEQVMAFIGEVAKYSPDQPRAPKGSEDGGQWIDAGGGGSGKWSDLSMDFAVNPLNEREVLIGDMTGKGPLGGVIMSDYSSKFWILSELRSITPHGGRAALTEVTRLADLHGKSIQLYASPFDSPGGITMSQSRLTKWYEGFGFKKVGGGMMHRKPSGPLRLGDKTRTVEIGKADDEWFPIGPPMEGELDAILEALAVAKFDPNQPRWPRGDHRGGQWRDMGISEGGDEADVVYEVAPNPDDEELTRRWDSLTDDEKQTISNEIANEVTPKLLKELGVEGRVSDAMGGFEGHMNPSFILHVDDNAYDVAGIIGDAYAQKAMVVIGAGPGKGLRKNGIASIIVPDADPATLRMIERDLGDIATDGWTYSNGRVQILNFSKKSNVEFAAEIDKRLGGTYTVQHGDIHSAYIGRSQYASPRSVAGGNSWREIRGRYRERVAAAMQAKLTAVGKAAEAEGWTCDPFGVLKFDPNQPRAPKGTPTGGQWVDAGGTGDAGADYEKELLEPKATPDEAPFDYTKAANGSYQEYEGVSIRVGGSPGAPSWMAAYELAGNGQDKITINRDFLIYGNETMRGTISESHRQGWLGTDHPNHVIWHEIGHAKFARARGWNQGNMIMDVREFHPAFPEFGEVASRVSGMATVNGAEFLAEYYAGRRAGKKYDRDVKALARKIMNHTKAEEQAFLRRQREYNERNGL